MLYSHSINTLHTLHKAVEFFLMADAHLIKKCLKKDKESWQIFLSKYSRIVYWAIHNQFSRNKFSCSETDIEDIFQDTFLTILENNKLAQLKDIRSVSGWLAMIASNKTIDYIRKKISLKEELVIDFPKIGNFQQEEEMLSRDYSALINEIIEQLPDKEKMVISLNLLENKSYKQIAKIMSLPINTVSTIIFRTKEKIRNKLKKMKEMCD